MGAIHKTWVKSHPRLAQPVFPKKKFQRVFTHRQMGQKLQVFGGLANGRTGPFSWWSDYRIIYHFCNIIFHPFWHSQLQILRHRWLRLEIRCTDQCILPPLYFAETTWPEMGPPLVRQAGIINNHKAHKRKNPSVRSSTMWFKNTVQSIEVKSRL